jgi:uncharacterized protein (TIGR02271 family)
MAQQQNGTVVGVFHDHDKARAAIRALKDAGFREDQIGVASSGHQGLQATKGDAVGDESYTGEGAMTGVAAGAGIGALWGLGILAGALPVIGPAIAGGTLAVILSSAAAGAAAAGLAGALIGMGISKDEAEYYESELKAGRTVVTVNAAGRNAEALAVLQRYGGYDMATRGTSTATSTATSSAACSTTGAAMQGSGCHTASAPAGSKTMSGAGCDTVQAHEERLNVQKTPVEAGEVTVRKEVHTEHKTIDVPVTREEVVVERRPGSSAPVSASNIAPGQEIHIPVKEEQVNVGKQTVVAEEVSVGKRKVQDTQRVGETLRKEEIKVETEGDARVRDQRDPRK